MQPLSLQKRIKWGDCDASGYLHLPRVFDYAMEIIDLWHWDILGTSWIRMKENSGLGMPTVRLEGDLSHPLECGQPVTLRLSIEKVGRASVDFSVEGLDDAGHRAFRVQVTGCLTDLGSKKSMPLPEEARRLISAYQAAGGECNI